MARYSEDETSEEDLADARKQKERHAKMMRNRLIKKGATEWLEILDSVSGELGMIEAMHIMVGEGPHGPTLKHSTAKSLVHGTVDEVYAEAEKTGLPLIELWN